MPYITQKERNGIDVGEYDVSTVKPGFVTYALYNTCLLALPDEPRYADYNTLLGALEATKLELYRRHIAPYEEQKMKENGDVG